MDKEKEKIKNFIINETTCIRQCQESYSYERLKNNTKSLFKILWGKEPPFHRKNRKEMEKEELEKLLSHAHDVQNALRYLSFFLADSSRHSLAMSCAFLHNRYRRIFAPTTRLNRIILWLQEKVTGYFLRPLRIVITAAIVWAFTGGVFWGLSE
jgi:hypothetical protein